MTLTKRELKLLTVALSSRQLALHKVLQDAKLVLSHHDKLPAGRDEDTERLVKQLQDELTELHALERKLSR